MTQRDFYTAVINANVSDELNTFATEAIAKLDTRNAKRSSTMTIKQKQNETIKKSIVDFVGDGGCLASQIASGLELSTSKASALCRQLVVDGIFKVEDVKVKGKGMQKLYSLAE